MDIHNLIKSKLKQYTRPVYWQPAAVAMVISVDVNVDVQIQTQVEVDGKSTLSATKTRVLRRYPTSVSPSCLDETPHECENNAQAFKTSPD